MAIGTSTGLGGGPADTGLLPVPDAPVRRRQLPRSPKVLIGLGTLAVFLVIAVVGPWIAPYDPSRTFSTTASFPLPPSAAHWLGTTQQQQDVFSQLLAGGRSTVLVAFVAVLAVGLVLFQVGSATDDKAQAQTAADAAALAELVHFAGEGLGLALWTQLAGPGGDPWEVGRKRVRSETGGVSYRLRSSVTSPESQPICSTSTSSPR